MSTGRGVAAHGFTILETLFVVALIGVIGVIAAPMIANTMADFRVTGDVRSVSNGMALAKMRAASAFTRTRLFVDLTSEEHHLQAWDKTTSTWTTEGGSTYLSPGVSFSYGVVATAPPSTQATIGQAPECTDDMGMVIANTACVMFNSRGVPIDSTFAPTAVDALYLSSGTAVYGVTVAATGMIRTWRTNPEATPTWVLE